MNANLIIGLAVIFVVSVVVCLPVISEQLGDISTQLAKIAAELEITNSKK